MNRETRNRFYQKATDAWGKNAQVDVVVEELAEAIVAVCHLRRGKCNVDALAGEMADVLIMFEQLEHMTDGLSERVEIAMDEKMTRLMKRLMDHEFENGGGR